MTVGYTLSSLAKVCIAREFTHVGAGAHVADRRLVARARPVAAPRGAAAPGVGAVGMCFSGGFALGMMVDDVMVAPVAVAAVDAVRHRRCRAQADLNLSPDDRLVVGQRAADGCQVLGLRFVGDRMVGTRFDALRDLLGDAFIAVELPSPTKRAHSVLTEHRDDAAVGQVIDFLRAKLHPAPS